MEKMDAALKRLQDRPSKPRKASAPVDAGLQRLQRADDRNVPRHRALRQALRDGPRQTAAVQHAIATVDAYMLVRANEAAMFGTQPTLLALCGPTRTGKTVALSLAIASVDAPALYVTTYQMADVPRPYRWDEAHPWNTWRTIDVLAIDELHADETVTPRVRALLYERWDNGRCTLLAGNLLEETFMERYLSDLALRRRVEEEYGPAGKLGRMEFAVTVTCAE